MLNVVTFTPEQWSELDRFKQFWRAGVNLSSDAQKKLLGARNHLSKAMCFLDMAKRNVPFLAEDEAQLEKFGYSPANATREIAALVEAIFLELYSAVDCSKTVFVNIYKPKYTEKESGEVKKISGLAPFFKKPRETEIHDLPKELAAFIVETTEWFDSLNKLRNELVHSNIGNCTRNPNGMVGYIHQDGGITGGRLFIEDVFGEIAKYIEEIEKFFSCMFGHVNKALPDNPSIQVCGFFNGGFLYERMATPSVKNFNDGNCKSYEWFEQPGKKKCPFTDKCGAYTSAHSSIAIS